MVERRQRGLVLTGPGSSAGWDHCAVFLGMTHYFHSAFFSRGTPSNEQAYHTHPDGLAKLLFVSGDRSVNNLNSFGIHWPLYI